MYFFLSKLVQHIFIEAYLLRFVGRTFYEWQEQLATWGCYPQLFIAVEGSGTDDSRVGEASLKLFTPII